MALQYWRSLGRPERHRLFTVRGGYHGDTFGAMAVCDPVGGMHALWSGVLPPQVFADAPPAGFDAGVDPVYADHLDRVVGEHADELAAIVVEPVAQGAGGMRFHDPGYLAVLRELADRHRVLLVFDEIATGFGRTGELLAADHAGVCPDVMCLGKALTGGYLTMAAALCTAEVAEGISEGEGNPLAAAVARASIDLLLAGDWRGEVARIEAGLRAGLAPAADLPGVADVRVLGAIGVIQLDHPVAVGPASRAAVERRVWLRPFADLVYTMPPYVTGDDDLALIGEAAVAAAAAG
jgi:adenosylmethionine-8-amino-7-oxononanoate aminotransferase